MDRHVEFATQLSHLVALYARDPIDRAAEKAALRAARGAAKHGAIELSLVNGVLRAGPRDVEDPHPDVEALQLLLSALGVSAINVAHHAKQEEVKRLAQLLGAVAVGKTSPQAFADELAAHRWEEVTVERVVAAESPPAETAETLDAAGAPTAAKPADEQAVAEPLDAAPAARPEESPAEVLDVVAADGVAEGVAEVVAEGAAPAADAPSRPLAERLPEGVEQLAGPEYRGLFERLITSSEPLTLRRLLEPVQSAIEQTARGGQVALSARLVLSMFACEACADDSEMRRQFVVTLRRLTKPTLTRAYAVLYAGAPEVRSELEQVLARFGEDGAEAVADCIGSAPTRAVRALYLELMSRLPGTKDALVAMLDDQREIVVERAIGLMVELRHPEMERALGDQLGAERTRVRQAAARALAAAKDSNFAADALVRAAQDASPEVRLAAAVALQGRREERLVASILPLVDAEEELDVQLALVAVLGKIVTAEGVQKLIALANPTDRMLRRRRAPVLRLHAIEALGEARTPAAMVALQKLLEDKEQDVREAAARLYTRARRQTAATGMAAVSGT
jgi:HEAT repeat protein